MKESDKRINILLVFMLAFFPVIIGRLFYIQIIKHSYYLNKAINNSTYMIKLYPIKGKILDRNYKILLKDKITYNMYVSRNGIISKVSDDKVIFNESLINDISIIFDKDKEEIKKKFQKIYNRIEYIIKKKLSKIEYLKNKNRRKYRKRKRNILVDYRNRLNLLYRNLPHDEVVLFNYKDYKKIKFKEKDYYYYCYNNVAVHLLDNIKYLYAPVLKGKEGCIFKDREGNIIFESPSYNGTNIVLTIDIDLQKMAEEELEKTIERIREEEAYRYKEGFCARGGAAVLIDLRNGDILVLASVPRYNANELRKIYRELISRKDAPLINRAINYDYPPYPGSTFKILVGLYSLEKGIIDENTTYYCSKVARIYNRNYRCTHYHGNVDIIKAIEGSCNIFFYYVGKKLGLYRLQECARIFGLGRKTYLFLRENSGRIPKNSRRWTKGCNLLFAIGQKIEATPIQIARAMAIVSTRNLNFKLEIIKNRNEINKIVMENVNDNIFEEKGIKKNRDKSLYQYKRIKELWLKHIQENNFNFKIDESNLELIKEGMRRVTEGEHGTATKVIDLLDGLHIASKTGTAQTGGRRNDHSWFAGFAPLNNPIFAFVVYIENGGYGNRCAPIAVKLIKEALRRYGDSE